MSAAVVVAGCGGSGVEGGSLAQQENPVDLSGQSYTVGGKQGDDHAILCEIAVAALQSVGAQAENRCSLGDSDTARKALLAGDIDMYWENTGTAWVKFLDQKTVKGASAQYRAVQDKDRKDNDVVWLEPTWFNPTYALAMNKDRAEQLKLESISDLAEYVRSGKPGNICVQSAYQQDAEGGLPGLARAYNVELPGERVRVMGADEIFPATAEQRDCLVGQVTAGDPRLSAHNLTTLRDDEKYHPPLNAAITVRKDAFERDEEISRVFQPIARMITDTVMSDLRRQMADEGMSAQQVAHGWLREMGFIEGGVE